MAKGGARPGAGRKKGGQNKFTKSIKEAFECAFNELQTDNKTSLTTWAKLNPTEFYKLSQKLIPTTMQHQGSLTLQVLSGLDD